MFVSSGTTKRRSTLGPVFSCKTTAGATAFQDPRITVNIRSTTGGTQVTESEGNQWPPPRGGDFVDCGSEFFTQKTEVIPSRIPYMSLPFYKRPDNDLTRNFTVEGRFYVVNAWGPNIPLTGDGEKDSQYFTKLPFVDSSSSRDQLNVKGAEAIAACSPTNQIAKAATAVGELLQDVPKLPGFGLWQSQIRTAELLAAGAGEFLNAVFGILPTISDMTQFYSGVHKVDRAVDQFIRDSGRLVRRSYHFPKERTISSEVLPGQESPVGYQSGANNLYAQPAFCLPSYETIRTRVIEREIWFSGAFTYHLPGWFDNNRSDRMALTARLLGAAPDLDTLWNLAPWSWAVDWLVNAGSFIKNTQSMISYGTVMQYGYVMEKTITSDTYTVGNVIQDADPAYKSAFKQPYPPVFPLQLRTTTKKRIQANPFGFGVSWDGLSDIQRAIVAALGISRAVR